MNQQIKIDSISISKSKNDQNFTKYDIEVSLEEIENSDGETKVKYGFILLSNPKNIRINVEGVALIHGNSSDITRFLEQDKNNIPCILHIIYQEIFPLFYTNSLAMQIPCPAYKLSQMDTPAQTTPTQIPSSSNVVTTTPTEQETSLLLPEIESQIEKSKNIEAQKPSIEMPTA